LPFTKISSKSNISYRNEYEEGVHYDIDYYDGKIRVLDIGGVPAIPAGTELYMIYSYQDERAKINPYIEIAEKDNKYRARLQRFIEAINRGCDQEGVLGVVQSVTINRCQIQEGYTSMLDIDWYRDPTRVFEDKVAYDATTEYMTNEYIVPHDKDYCDLNHPSNPCYNAFVTEDVDTFLPADTSVTNDVIDGSFEIFGGPPDYTDWTNWVESRQWNGAGIYKMCATTWKAHEGSNSLCHHYEGYPGGNRLVINSVTTKDFIPVNPANTYTVSYWHVHVISVHGSNPVDDPPRDTLRVYCYDVGDNYLGTKDFTRYWSGHDWQQSVYTVSPGDFPVGTTQIKINIVHYGQLSSAYQYDHTYWDEVVWRESDPDEINQQIAIYWDPGETYTEYQAQLNPIDYIRIHFRDAWVGGYINLYFANNMSEDGLKFDFGNSDMTVDDADDTGWFPHSQNPMKHWAVEANGSIYIPVSNYCYNAMKVKFGYDDHESRQDIYLRKITAIHRAVPLGDVGPYNFSIIPDETMYGGMQNSVETMLDRFRPAHTLYEVDAEGVEIQTPALVEHVEASSTYARPIEGPDLITSVDDYSSEYLTPRILDRKFMSARAAALVYSVVAGYKIVEEWVTEEYWETIWEDTTESGHYQGPDRIIGVEDSSNTCWFGYNASIYGHRASHAKDFNMDTYWISVGNYPGNADWAYEWVTFMLDGGENINHVSVRWVWAPKKMYVHVMTPAGWQGNRYCPYNPGAPPAYPNGSDLIPYVQEFDLPQINEHNFSALLSNSYQTPTRLRLTFYDLPPTIGSFAPGMPKCRASIREAWAWDEYDYSVGKKVPRKVKRTRRVKRKKKVPVYEERVRKTVNNIFDDNTNTQWLSERKNSRHKDVYVDLYFAEGWTDFNIVKVYLPSCMNNTQIWIKSLDGAKTWAYTYNQSGTVTISTGRIRAQGFRLVVRPYCDLSIPGESINMFGFIARVNEVRAYYYFNTADCSPAKTIDGTKGGGLVNVWSSERQDTEMNNNQWIIYNLGGTNGDKNALTEINTIKIYAPWRNMYYKILAYEPYVSVIENVKMVGTFPMNLSHDNVKPGSEFISEWIDPGIGETEWFEIKGREPEIYEAGVDYEIDYTGGYVTRKLGGSIDDGQTIEVTYAYPSAEVDEGGWTTLGTVTDTMNKDVLYVSFPNVWAKKLKLEITKLHYWTKQTKRTRWYPWEKVYDPPSGYYAALYEVEASLTTWERHWNPVYAIDRNSLTFWLSEGMYQDSYYTIMTQIEGYEPAPQTFPQFYEAPEWYKLKFEYEEGTINPPAINKLIIKPYTVGPTYKIYSSLDGVEWKEIVINEGYLYDSDDVPLYKGDINQLYDARPRNIRLIPSTVTFNKRRMKYLRFDFYDLQPVDMAIRRANEEQSEFYYVGLLEVYPYKSSNVGRDFPFSFENFEDSDDIQEPEIGEESATWDGVYYALTHPLHVYRILHTKANIS